MDQISHKFVNVNGLKLHVAELGSDSSPAVIFLHGFPEIWYTWRYQMIAVAKAGFRAIAPDFRGYGLSDEPAEPEKASFNDLIIDTAAILDSLGISQVFVVGNDFGAIVAYPLALLYPEKVVGIITLGIPFMPPGAFTNHFSLPESFYPRRWQEPGRAEADFGRFDIKTVVRNIYILFSQSELQIANEKQEIMDLVKPSSPLPAWFTEEDLEVYAKLYENSGFRTPLQVPYRSIDTIGSEVFANHTRPPDKLIETIVETVRLKLASIKFKRSSQSVSLINEWKLPDYVLKIPGIHEYVTSGEVKKYVPKLETIYVPHGSHFLQEQFPDHVNQLILTFLDRNKNLAST